MEYGPRETNYAAYQLKQELKPGVLICNTFKIGMTEERHYVWLHPGKSWSVRTFTIVLPLDEWFIHRVENAYERNRGEHGMFSSKDDALIFELNSIYVEYGTPPHVRYYRSEFDDNATTEVV